jgi:serine/threonine protein kinase
MSLQAGTRLDHYEILELIGRGGMGEVYSAKDPRLPREVAIKISELKFTDRFRREVQVIASLNHPYLHPF